VKVSNGANDFEHVRLYIRLPSAQAHYHSPQPWHYLYRHFRTQVTTEYADNGEQRGKGVVVIGEEFFFQ